MAEFNTYVGFRLGHDCWVGVTHYDCAIIVHASGLLSFRRCCALRLEGKSQVGINPTSVSTEGRIMPCYCTMLHDSLHLLVLAGRHPVYL